MYKSALHLAAGAIWSLVAVTPAIEPSVSYIEDFAYTLLSVGLAYGCCTERTSTWTAMSVGTVLYPLAFNLARKGRR